VESTSIHYLKTKLCVGCSKGFEIVDLETLDTQPLLDPHDELLEFVRRKEGLRPMAIYRIHNEFLLCYDGTEWVSRRRSIPLTLMQNLPSMSTKTAVDQGRTSSFNGKANLLGSVSSIHREMTASPDTRVCLALHEPFVLAFAPSFVEIRHVETGMLIQVIQGSNLRLLFADTPPSVTNTGGSMHYNPYPPG
jgi:RHO1 GDP-GTP exchange protein 1/2